MQWSSSIIPEQEANCQDKNLRFEYFHCGEKGGQNVNKVETGVRLIHLPMGITVTSTAERSQFLNKKNAIEKLDALLKSKEKEQTQLQINSAWKEQNKLVRGNPVRVYQRDWDFRGIFDDIELDEIFAFVREMKKCGKTSIGFIGEQLHCQSFFERCMATRNALYINSLPINEEFFIIDAPKDTLTDYKTYLFNYIQNLKELPDVFVCANDFIAFDLMQILRQLNIQVPEDICLCGFDDSPAAKLITPPLTSIHIHNEILGVCAIDLLLSRIKDPTLNYRTVYTETNIVYRESTNIAPTK